ncbi:uncharacterized protein LOC142527646 isoform X3 [Primulina tabacum]|uniref:uncharacterized protein LOC142527646 isoform X3 n=1 Tax=Primulina tabacum TaxID=48773 RepID=UPI003F59A56B
MASLFHHSTAQNANTKRVMAFSPRRQKTVGNNECLLHSSLLCSFVFNPVFPLLAIGKLLPFTGGTEKQLREERTFAGPINN